MLAFLGLFSLSGGIRHLMGDTLESMQNLMVLSAGVIYADEPTGNLDRTGGDRIIHLLRDRQRSANRLHQALHVAVDCFGVIDRSCSGVVGPKRANHGEPVAAVKSGCASRYL